MVYKSQAPGKLIISGEHAVVYGYPALAAAISLYTTAEAKPKKGKGAGFELSVTSNIPRGSGLGSSASLSAASTLAILKYLRAKPTKPLLNKIVYEIEKGVHGTPSGVDNTTVVYGGMIVFQKKGENFHFNQLKLKKDLPNFLLVQSGQPQETTKEMIKKVAALKTNRKTLQEIGKVTDAFIKNLKKGSFDPELIRKNQRLLERLGVVETKAKRIVHLIEEVGGVAKVCGAGGVKEGSGILLAYHPQIEKIKTLAQKNNWEYFSAEIGVEGTE